MMEPPLNFRVLWLYVLMAQPGWLPTESSHKILDSEALDNGYKYTPFRALRINCINSEESNPRPSHFSTVGRQVYASENMVGSSWSFFEMDWGWNLVCELYSYVSYPCQVLHIYDIVLGERSHGSVDKQLLQNEYLSLYETDLMVGWAWSLY